MSAYPGSRVDVDAGQGMGLFGDDSRDDGNPHFVQFVGHPVVDHGQNDRIGENHFTVGTGRRIVGKDGFYVGVEHVFKFGQPIYELLGQPVALFFGLLRVVLVEEQGQGGLLFQQTNETFHVHADVV